MQRQSLTTFQPVSEQWLSSPPPKKKTLSFFLLLSMMIYSMGYHFGELKSAVLVVSPLNFLHTTKVFVGDTAAKKISSIPARSRTRGHPSK